MMSILKSISLLMMLAVLPFSVSLAEEEGLRPIDWPQENATDPYRPLVSEDSQLEQQEAFAWSLEEEFEEEED